MQKFLGHALVQNRKINFILTNKLLFFRCFDKVPITLVHSQSIFIAYRCRNYRYFLSAL